jgi:16S rRNA (cytosine967-C5)-methyltransferase
VDISVHDIAVEVIRTAGRDKPADQALREVLKAMRDLPPFDAAEVSRAVFTYYRWHGWLRDERTADNRMRLARRLAERFRSNPTSFPPAELRANVVPPWTAQEMEVSDEWLHSLQQETTLWLRAKHGMSETLLRSLPGMEKRDALPDALVYAGEIDLFRTPEFHAGEFEIQDIASQAVSWLCAPKPGETWWDTCAGEGGKLVHLSDLMQNKGLIWASDRAEWRLQKLKRRTARAKAFNYRAAQWDGGAKLPTKTKFDGILADAPCSGLGTWQRNPHARWTTTVEDVRELAEVQKKLLTHVAGSVKPGGKLIYSVCTLTRAETTGVVDQFNASQPDFEPMLLPELKSNGRTIGNAPTVMIWPQDLGGNGMYIAGWRRKKSPKPVVTSS